MKSAPLRLQVSTSHLLWDQIVSAYTSRRETYFWGLYDFSSFISFSLTKLNIACFPQRKCFFCFFASLFSLRACQRQPAGQRPRASKFNYHTSITYWNTPQVQRFNQLPVSESVDGQGDWVLQAFSLLTPANIWLLRAMWMCIIRTHSRVFITFGSARLWCHDCKYLSIRLCEVLELL